MFTKKTATRGIIRCHNFNTCKCLIQHLIADIIYKNESATVDKSFYRLSSYPFKSLKHVVSITSISINRYPLNHTHSEYICGYLQKMDHKHAVHLFIIFLFRPYVLNILLLFVQPYSFPIFYLDSSPVRLDRISFHQHNTRCHLNSLFQLRQIH